MKKFLFGLAPLMVMAVFIVSGAAAGSASAATFCMEAKEPAVNGNWKERVPNNPFTGVCKTVVAAGTGTYLRVNGSKMLFKTTTEACAESEEPLVVGNYTSSECTAASKVANGKGTFVKVMPSQCLEFVLCSGVNEKLRDDATVPPVGGGFGTSALAVNTAGALRFGAKVAKLAVHNENPQGYAFFGVKLVANEATSTTLCHKANGFVTFVDIQNAKPSAVYDNTEKAWPIEVKSDNSGCLAAEQGKVTIEGAKLFFPGLANLVAAGVFTGKWVQPGECPGGSGGVKLDVKQPLIEAGEKETAEIDNGEAGKNAFVCFVSANNYLYPEKAPTWSPFIGNIWKD